MRTKLIDIENNPMYSPEKDYLSQHSVSGKNNQVKKFLTIDTQSINIEEESGMRNPMISFMSLDKTSNQQKIQETKKRIK
jgi:hypothetical protein